VQSGFGCLEAFRGVRPSSRFVRYAVPRSNRSRWRSKEEDLPTYARATPSARMPPRQASDTGCQCARCDARIARARKHQAAERSMVAPCHVPSSSKHDGTADVLASREAQRCPAGALPLQ
jgi:hypothetical protein